MKTIQETIFMKNRIINPQFKTIKRMSNLQRKIFWKNQRVVSLIKNNKIIAWYGFKLQNTSQDFVDGVSIN